MSSHGKSWHLVDGHNPARAVASHGIRNKFHGPPLLETHNFFATLDIDAEKAMGDGAQTVLVESFERQPGEKGAVHFHVETSFIPRDVFREVGITLTPIPESQS